MEIALVRNGHSRMSTRRSRSREAARRAFVASALLLALALTISSSSCSPRGYALDADAAAAAAAAAAAWNGPVLGLTPGIVANRTTEAEGAKSLALYTLQDLSPVRTYTYDRPTLVHSDGLFAGRKMWTQASTFWDEYISQLASIPCIITFPNNTEVSRAKYLSRNGHPLRKLNLTGLAIFGGSLVDTLLGRRPKDVDMCFFCSEEDPEKIGIQLARRVEQVVNDLNDIFFWEDKAQLLVTRYKSTYEISHPGLKLRLQVVPKPSLDALLRNTEDYTSLAFYEGELLLSERAKFSLENYATVADDRHMLKAHRLCKSWEKGFDIILPGLNMTALHRRNLAFRCSEVLDLPHLTVIYNHIEGNKIVAERMCGGSHHDADAADDINVLPMGEGESGSASSFAGYGDAQRDIGAIIHHNIRVLAHGENDRFVYFGQGENWRTVFSAQVPITERALINSYENVRKGILAAEPLSLGKIESYFTIKPLPVVFDELLIKYCFKNDTRNGSSGSTNDSAGTSGAPRKRSPLFSGVGLRSFKQHLWRRLRSLTREQIDASKQAITALNRNASLAVPVFDAYQPCSAREWYGKYHMASAGDGNVSKTHSR